MKKLLLALLLLFSLFVSAQETFVRRYNHYYSSLEKEGKIGQITFVINDNDTNQIKVYVAQKKTKTLYQIGGVEKGVTESGYPYQIINCVDDDGNRLAFQLFANSVRLIFIEFGTSIEYYNE